MNAASPGTPCQKASSIRPLALPHFHYNLIQMHVSHSVPSGR